jgi:signal transduction histidine kinase
MQLGTLWRFLTEPHPSITDLEQRRQSRLLAGLILSVAFTALLASILVIINSAGSQEEPPVFTWTGVGLSLVIYFINRSGRYQISAALFVALNLFLMLLLPILSGHLEWALFGSMVLLLSAILMSPRVTRAVFLMNLVSLVILKISQPDATLLLTPLGPAIVFGVTAPLVLIFIAHRAGLERERQVELKAANQKLRESEAMLERRVAERTQELSAAKEEAEIARGAEAADRLKAQFLASMSHELRTPLNAILNFTEMMGLGMVGPVTERQKDILSKSLNSGRHLLSLINDVLDVTKVQSGMLNLFIEDNVNLYEEVEAVAAVAETMLQDKPVDFVQEVEQGLPLIRGDRRRIRQILLNLLGNAAKFTDDGRITLHVQRRGDDIYMAVSDTGPGIAPEKQSIIFEPFVQTETGIQHANGTGLGLPISRWLVEAHGGRLWVESEMERGSTFHLLLPGCVNGAMITDSKSN